MAFFSGSEIKKHLHELVLLPGGKRVDENDIDCSSFTLRMGPEAYITRTKESINAKGHTKFQLVDGEHFEIPAGQFAFLLTEEIIRIPYELMAFISIKAKWKFRGLVNVSGFHVDPGYNGRLVFSVFNAGPAPITLSRGERLFLIWFTELVGGSAEYSKHSDTPEQLGLNPELINQLSGNVYSPMVLKERIDETRKYVDDEVTKIHRWMAGLVIAAVGAIIIAIVKGWSPYKGNEVYGQSPQNTSYEQIDAEKRKGQNIYAPTGKVSGEKFEVAVDPVKSEENYNIPN